MHTLSTALLAALMSSALSASAQGLVYDWAGAMGSIGQDEGRGIAVDAEGHVFTVGIFEGSGDFDPGAGTATLASAGGQDVFISKLNSTGGLAWAKRIGGASDDHGNAIAVDGSGHVYIAGAFAGAVDFDPGDSVEVRSSNGIAYDVFVLKLDADGEYLWSARIGSTAPDHAYGMTVDASGDVVVTGAIEGTCDMDPGVGTALLEAGAFVLKLDANGVFQWARQLGAFGDVGMAVRTDGSGNVYTAGRFSGTNDFDPGAGSQPLTSAGESDIFAVKLDAGGGFVWARSMGGTDVDQVNALALDADENVYLTGDFRGTCDFDPGAGTYALFSENGLDAFTLKLDASGAFIWAFAVGGTTFGSSDRGFGIAVDAAGTVYTTGNFLGNVDFDPGPASSFLNSGNTTNIFVQVVDTEGGFLWAGQMGGGSFNYNSGMAIALGTDAVHVTGSFVSTTVDFDPGEGVQPFSSAGGYDVFVLKLADDLSTASPAAAMPAPQVRLFPNPATDHLRLETGGMALTSVALVDGTGRTLLEQALPGSMSTVLNVSDVPNGAYVLMARTKHGTATSVPVHIAR